MSDDLVAYFHQIAMSLGDGLAFVGIVATFFAFCCACEELYDWHQERMRRRR